MPVDVLIGTYTGSLDHVDGTADGILGAVARDEVGDVRLLVPASNPSYLAVSRDGHVYAVDEGGGRVAAFSPQLEPLGSVATGGDAPCHVALSPDEGFVLVAHYASGSVSVHPRSSDGAVDGPVAHVRHGDGAHAHMCFVDPTDGSVLVPDLGLDTVFVYMLDDSGSLTETARLSLLAGTGPRHVALGALLHVLGELGNTVTSFERTPDGWRAVSSVSTLPVGWDGHSQAAAITLSGDRLYVTNRGHDSIAAFAVAPIPVLLGHTSAHGRAPRDLLVTPDGTRLITANQDSNALALFAVERDGLRWLSSTPAPTPVCVVLAPAR